MRSMKTRKRPLLCRCTKGIELRMFLNTSKRMLNLLSVSGMYGRTMKINSKNVGKDQGFFGKEVWINFLS